MEKKDTAKKNKNKPKVSIVFKSILGIVILFVVFSLIVSVMGFRNFTDALLDQYSDGAFRTANTAVMEFDVSKIEDYAASGGTTKEYTSALESMERLCNSSGSTFIYIIRPDLSDYKHITFLFPLSTKTAISPAMNSAMYVKLQTRNIWKNIAGCTRMDPIRSLS